MINKTLHQCITCNIFNSTRWHIKSGPFYHTHNENFWNISTIRKTLIKSVRCKHVYLWHHELHNIFNINNIAKDINSLLSPDPISSTNILQEWNHCWATVYVNYVDRLHDGTTLYIVLVKLLLICWTIANDIKLPQHTNVLQRPTDSICPLTDLEPLCQTKVSDMQMTCAVLFIYRLITVWVWDDQ